MSYIGQLTRGSKWFNLNRDVNGDIKETVAKDVDKMKDVNFFLDRTTPETRDVVTTKLLNLQELSHAANGIRSKLYADLKAELVALPVNKVEEVKEIKSKGSK